MSLPQPPSDEAAIALLQEIVSLYSPSTQEWEVAAHLAEWMSALGYRAEVDSAGNAVGYLGRGERQFVLLGHMDTVPGQVPVRREGDLLYGRGAVDAKGPLAAFVVAAARAAADPRFAAAGVSFVVVGAVEEESATSKGARYAAGRYRPSCALIGEPSGWDRITLGYKGRLLLDYLLQQPVAHTAGEARGACERAVDFWLHLARLAEDYNRDRPARFDTLDPSLRQICSRSDGLVERVEMHLGLRLPLGYDVPALLADLDARRGPAEIRTHAQEEPFRAEKRNSLTGAFLVAIRAEGGKPAFVTKTGTSDMNVLGPVWRCPMVAYGPGDSALDHTPDEHIDLREYLAAVRVLERVLLRLAEGQERSDTPPHATVA